MVQLQPAALMGKPSVLDDLLDYTQEEDLEEIRRCLQGREQDQNILDGGDSRYTFTREDALEYRGGIVGEDPSLMESRNIAPLFKNRESES